VPCKIGKEITKERTTNLSKLACCPIMSHAKKKKKERGKNRGEMEEIKGKGR